MKIPSIPLNKVLKITLAAAALIVAFSIAYYFVFFLPKEMRAQLDQQNQAQLELNQQQAGQEKRKQEAADDLNKCLDNVNLPRVPLFANTRNEEDNACMARYNAEANN